MSQMGLGLTKVLLFTVKTYISGKYCYWANNLKQFVDKKKAQISVFYVFFGWKHLKFKNLTILPQCKALTPFYIMPI